MSCPACGRENREGAEYCAWCGLALELGRPTIRLPDLYAGATDSGDAASARGGVATASSSGSAPAHEVGASTPAVGDDTGSPWGTNGELPPFPHPDSGGREEEPEALSPGDIVADRFQITARLESGPEFAAYSAVDLRACPQCGDAENEFPAPFCAFCGASLATRPSVTLAEHVRSRPKGYDEHVTIGDRDYYVTLAEGTASALETKRLVSETAQLRLSWGYATDPGLAHDTNEDFCHAWVYERSGGDSLGLFVVADGLGGQDSGEVASSMATQTVWQALRESVWEPFLGGESPDPERLKTGVLEAIARANQAVYEARTARASEMSTTLALALVCGDTAVVGNVGDSRVYVAREGGLERTTRDHSLVQRLVDAGEIAADEVYTHPQRNLIYQSIGDRPDVRIDTYQVSLHPDDRLLLCSDGLWEMVRDDGLEDVLLSEQDPQRACGLLVRSANLAGGDDNISVIIVQAKRVDDRTE